MSWREIGVDREEGSYFSNVITRCSIGVISGTYHYNPS